MTASRFEAPSTVSEQARRFLAADTAAQPPLPPAEAHDAWDALIRGTNAYIAKLSAGAAALPVTVDRQDIAGVSVAVAEPDGIETDGPVYLDFHGGALIYGGGDLLDLTVATTAAGAGMTTWAPDYRMPPKHPYPAGLDDAVAVYRALLQVKAPNEIVVGGASAGGNIAAALVLRAKAEGLPLPAALVLLSPEVDLTESGDSFTVLNGVDNVLSPLMDINLLYAAGASLTDPFVSPLFGDLHDFPPTLLQSGTRDLFLSNTVLMHRKLRQAGVYAQLHIFEAMPHGGFGGAPEDLEIKREVRGFLRGHLPVAETAVR